MVYKPETYEVALPDGCKAEMYKYLLHGTQRAVSEITRKYLTITSPSPDSTDGASSNDVQIDLSSVDWEAVNDVIILRQVVRWSYGMITQDTLDSLPEIVRGKFLEEVARYNENHPLPGSGSENSEGTFTRLSRLPLFIGCRRVWRMLYSLTKPAFRHR
jgi:hypothetical protein